MNAAIASLVVASPMPTYRGSEFTDESLLQLVDVESIRQLALHQTAVTDAGLAAFAERAKCLAELRLSSPLLTDRGLAAILARCPIASLQIDEASITDAAGAIIAAHPEITELYLNNTGLSDEATRHLARMPNVWLFCADGSWISDVGMNRLSAMPRLSILSLNRTRVRGDGLRSLAATCQRQAVSVHLDDCRLDDDQVAEALAEVGELGVPEPASPERRRAGTTPRTGLELLSLAHTDLTDNALSTIAACQTLQDLRLSGTAVTDATIDLIEPMTRLHTLYIQKMSGTPAACITHPRIAALRRRRPDLFVYSDVDAPDAGPEDAIGDDDGGVAT